MRSSECGAILCLGLLLVYITLSSRNETSEDTPAMHISNNPLMQPKASYKWTENGYSEDHSKPGYRKRLPQAIIIGAKKSGTTALSGYLRNHPDIKIHPPEAHFFDRQENFDKGMEYYRAFMLESYPHQITMEKTPRYWMNSTVPGRIYENLGPNMKFIVMLRDPVDRLHSDYNFNKKHLAKHFYMPESNHTLDQLVFLPSTKKVNPEYQPVMVSSYDDNMNRWLQYYPLHHFLLLENNDLRDTPLEVLTSIEKFLGVKEFFKEYLQHHAPQKRNAAKGHYNYMSDETRNILMEYFRPHSLNFFKIVNRTFTWKLYR